MKILCLLVSIYLAALAICVWCGSVELSRFSGGLFVLGGAVYVCVCFGEEVSELKLWIDDVRPAPDGYMWCKSVNGAKWYITTYEARAKEACEREPELSKYFTAIELVDIDHDAGDYAVKGGDYINLLNWFEETGRDYPIHIHSKNPVGAANMRRIIRRNGWKEVF